MIYRKRILALLLAAAMVVSLLSGCGGDPGKAKETKDKTYGIDVAKYQGTIDWDFVSRCNIDFAMVRIGYRTIAEGELHPDPNGKYNLQEAAKFGVKLGVYFFSTAISEEEAREEAQWVAEQIAQYPITYPVAYDCEGFRDPASRQYTLGKERRTDIALAFLEEIENLGYEGMFYGARNEMQDDAFWEVSRIEDEYKVWVAQYPGDADPDEDVSSYGGKHQMWQYTMEGSVAGINGPVDLNVAYFGYDGVSVPENTIPPEEVEPDIEALMNFTEVNEIVTAKDETNLRDIPSQDDTSTVCYTLKYGETATRVGISATGWSKLEFNGQTYYAVSSYLTTMIGSGAKPYTDIDIQTVFTPVNEQVTAKKEVNLRSLPSTEHPDCEVITKLKHGTVVIRTGINEDLGWSRVEYNGWILYCVSSYLEVVE